MNLRFYLLVSAVKQVNQSEVSPKFPCVTPVVQDLPHSFLWVRWQNLVRVQCLKIIKSMVIDFCSMAS